MFTRLIELSQQRLYWLLLVTAGIALEAGALFYQYALDEWPCVLCIHIRIWIFAFIIVGVLALFLTRSRLAMRVMHGLTLGLMIGLLERSYQVLAVERGWVFGDCGMDLGLPPWLSWLALDQWMPWLFEVQTTCGYTPLIAFNISMAEVLMVVSVLLAAMSAAMFVASWCAEPS